MASEKGPLATETPPVPPPGTVLISLAAPSEAVADLDGRRKSLKRSREITPTSPGQGDIPNLSALQAATTSPAKSARLNLTSRRSPTPLTAAAALEEERRRREDAQGVEFTGISDNPSHQALAALSGGALAMSRPTDAPVAAMEPAKPPPAVTIPPSNNAHMDFKSDTSPQSATSAASLAGARVMDSPTPMDVDGKAGTSHQPLSPQDKTPQPGSLSYPGSLHAGGVMPAPPARDVSFPTSSSGQTSPITASNKKHKCPYCDTEFTRHHNLKSHLLTHSQEKPYVCQDCQMRFRRLHDLKRHSKLHTGEKPHICPKCDRKFARGDALARHNKGAGGCAGRRSSMGSFADDDIEGVGIAEGDDSAMAYNEDMTEEDRRLSLPSIKAQHVAGSGPESYSPHSRTYPPAGTRANTTGGLYPPNVDRAASSNNTSPTGHTPNTSISSVPHSATTAASIYSQSGMTESPKPLSPGVPGHEAPALARQRSPSLTQQFQQQHFGRRATGDRNTPPAMALQASHSAVKLPALSGFAAPEARFAAGQASGATPDAGGHSRTSSTQGGSGDNSSNLFAMGDQAVWNYIQNLEEKLKVLSPMPEKLATMEKANTTLHAQVGALTAELQILSKDMGVLKQQLDTLHKAAAAPS